jgi:hypothetical protein
MIELTPFTLQSQKRLEAHTGPITEALLSPEEIEQAFSTKNGPGCRVPMAVSLGVGLTSMLLLFGGGFALFTGTGEAWLVPVICGFLLLLTGLVVYGAIRGQRQNEAWREKIRNSIGFPIVSAEAVMNPIGGELSLHFEQHPKQPLTLDTVQFQLVMHEGATYTSGTDTYTARREMIEDEDWHRGLSGGADQSIQYDFTLSIPNNPHTHPSWDGGNNRIRWRLRMNITYAEGSDPAKLEIEYLLAVTPQAAGSE